MFLTDPALRHIAADTGDVLPEQLWRHDTIAEDALGDIARILDTTALAYNTTTAYLDKAVQRLTDRRDLTAAGYGHLLPGMLAAIERHTVLAGTLTEAYTAWRRHRPIDRGAGGERYLLLRPGDPTYGVAILHAHGDHTWLVLPDAEAATAFDIPYPHRVVGQISQADNGWTPTAYTNPAHLHEQPAITYPLPVGHDLGSACRSLLRWWHLRHSAAWRSRRPEQLTEAELADLAR